MLLNKLVIFKCWSRSGFGTEMRAAQWVAQNEFGWISGNQKTYFGSVSCSVTMAGIFPKIQLATIFHHKHTCIVYCECVMIYNSLHSLPRDWW